MLVMGQKQVQNIRRDVQINPFMLKCWFFQIFVPKARVHCSSFHSGNLALTGNVSFCFVRDGLFLAPLMKLFSFMEVGFEMQSFKRKWKIRELSKQLLSVLMLVAEILSFDTDQRDW
jgi:hypothetical protein